MIIIIVVVIVGAIIGISIYHNTKVKKAKQESFCPGRVSADMSNPGATRYPIDLPLPGWPNVPAMKCPKCYQDIKYNKN